MGRRKEQVASCLIVTDGDVCLRWPYPEPPAVGTIVGTVMGPQRVRFHVCGPEWEAVRRKWAYVERLQFEHVIADLDGGLLRN